MSCSGSTTCGMVNPKSFDAIDGTPIKYGSPENYVRKTIKAERSFYAKLVDWIRTLRTFSGTYGPTTLRELRWIGHVGAYVCKDGCHGRGRAFDINRIQWIGEAVDMYSGDHASSDRTRRRRYLAVDACCRRYFKYTLDGWYNAQHANHIHVDDHTVPILDRGSVSDTGFVQAVCNNFNGAGLKVDGVWGTATQEAFQELNRTWGYGGCDPFSSEVAYAEWCNFVMAHGFADKSASDVGYRSGVCWRWS
jgi:hypothetical protein